MKLNKKSILLGVITGLVLVTSCFWYVQKKGIRKEVGQNNQQQEDEKKNVIDQLPSREDTKDQKVEDLMFEKLTVEESEKLKKEKDLAWYEIPELNIKFLVTRNSKNNLDYFKNDEYVHLFKKTVIKFNTKNFCQFNEATKYNICDDYAISFWGEQNETDEYGQYCSGVWISVQNSQNICITHRQSLNFASSKDYLEYLKIVEGEDLGIFLETVRVLK